MAFSWRVEPIVLLPRTQAPPAGGDPATAGGNAQAGGIAEDIDPKLRERYERWRAAYCSTDVGRKDWEAFANNPNFTLTIRMSEADEKGIKNYQARYQAQRGGVASTGYRWDGNGSLVAATIVLGSKLAREAAEKNGNYPVSSVAHLRGDDLAAVKIAHEFGHVKRTASLTPRETLDYQNELEKGAEVRRAYKPGNPTDADFLARSAELEDIAGNPQERERWAEANVIPFLEEKHGNSMPRETRDAIEAYRKQYPGR